MDTETEKKLRAVQHLRLGAQEKADLKDAFMRFMDTHPAPTPLQRSPLTIRLYASALAAAVFFAYVGSAEAALPGDAMYYFKTQVNEPVVRLFAVTDDLSAEVSHNILERRLEEASYLALDTKTEPEHWDIITEEFRKASEDAKDTVEDFIIEMDFAEAVEAAETQQALLHAHTAILSELSDVAHASSMVDILEEAGELAAFTEESVTELAPLLSDQPNIAQEVADSIHDTRLLMEHASSTLEVLRQNDTDDALELTKIVGRAMELISQSTSAATNEEYDTALLSSEEAQGLLSESLIILEQERELDIEVFPLSHMP